MSGGTTFSRLFGHSPFTALQQHMRAVVECAREVRPLIDALVAPMYYLVKILVSKLVILIILALYLFLFFCSFHLFFFLLPLWRNLKTMHVSFTSKQANLKQLLVRIWKLLVTC